MHLTLSPIRGLPGQPETVISVAGDVLTIDGVAYDLGAVPEGGRATPAPGAHPFVGAITREGGLIRATIRVVLDDTAAPDQPASPWAVTVTSGPVTCMDFAAFIDRIDRPGVLFYLDPPYYGCEDDYGRELFSRARFEELAEQLGRLKGRFILSLNDRPEVRDTSICASTSTRRCATGSISASVW
ncbi:hypothetical protein [Pararhodobacter marinus]|uniref:hypothetical protein n=1 Tax=Pararhodobacter marinus TaxID=2184063 RepID=UPI001AEFA4DA|nr:hypothetical protein [Pararhodobacter marinus]